MNKLQIKRGNKVNLPTLSEGELGYTLDKKELYIGNGTGNDLIISVDKIQYCDYTATTNGTTNVPFTFVDYDTNHDDMIVSYNGVLLENPDNYTVNANNSSIDLSSWSIDSGNVVRFRLYKNCK